MMMIQFGAVSIVTVAMFLKTEAVSLLIPPGFLNGQNYPWSRRLYMYSEPRLEYGTDIKDLTFPGQITLFTGSLSNEQIKPYERVNVNMPLQEDPEVLPLTTKRTINALPMISKRIHTCAFMRRLGLPIGLCFKGSRNRVSQQPVEETEESPEQNAYDYLQRQWPVHSMLGGGVGK